MVYVLWYLVLLTAIVIVCYAGRHTPRRQEVPVSSSGRPGRPHGQLPVALRNSADRSTM
jgi:hypothetical protein